MKVYHLRVNHMENPVIDNKPEFSFMISDEKENVFLKAYQIVVTAHDEIYWDSGPVVSDQNSFIVYDGKPLDSKTIYKYTIKAINNYDEEASTSALFETGLYQKDWKALWSESPFERNEHKMLSDGIENPVVSFSKEIEISKQIKKARLYASCYGVYRLMVNDGRADEREFAPEFTSYSKLMYYQTYVLDSLLHYGTNKLEFLVGDGWYFNFQTAPKNTDHPYPAIIYQLEIEYADGTKETIVSQDEDCRKTNIIYSDLFVGEKIDFTSKYSETKKALSKTYSINLLRAQILDYVKAVEEFKPVNIYRSKKNELIVDFGQVIAGRCRIKLKQEYARMVKLHHSEAVDPDGNYFKCLEARQRDTIVCNGEPIEYEPLFTFHGFRYVMIEGVDDIDKDDITAVLLSSKKEKTGDFYTDNKKLNRLYKNICYSQKNNMMSIPTDCPQREKAGWTGDVYVYGKTSMLHEEMTPFYTGWLENLKYDQYENGAVPIICPYTKMYEFVVKKTMQDFDDSKPTGHLETMLPTGEDLPLQDRMAGVAAWSDVMVMLPLNMYEITANKKILEEMYPNIKMWVDNIIETAASRRNEKVKDPQLDRYLWNTGFHFGEWLVPGKIQEGFEITVETSWYIAPMIAYQSVCNFIKIAQLLHKNTAYYQDIASKMKQAINIEVLPLDHEHNDYMGRYVLAIALEIVNDDLYETYKNKLVELVEENHYCLGTGFIGTPYVLDALDKIGRQDLSKKILFQNKLPSWLYEVEKGATSIWENWNAINEDGTPNKTSFDHYAYGVVEDYIFRNVSGLNYSEPGFKSFIIKPRTDLGIKKMHREFLSEQGLIEIDYEDETLTVTIPCNTRATVIWGNEERNVGSGKYIWKK